MEENKFWLLVWSLVASVVVTLIISIVSYNAYSNSLVRDMIAKGVNPIVANCSINGAERAAAAMLCMQALNKP